MNQLRLHGTKTSQKRLNLDQLLVSKDAEDGSEIQTRVEMVKRNGKEMERRETMNKGKMAVVEILDRILHGHDYLHNPGAIINENLTTDFSHKFKPRKVASGVRQLEQKDSIKNDELSGIMSPRDRLIFGRGRLDKSRIVSFTSAEQDGGNNGIQWRNFKEPSLTEKIESECYSTASDVAATAADPFELIENTSKLICLRSCAYTWPCTFVTFSEGSMKCQLYSKPPSEEWTEKKVGISLYTPLMDARTCVQNLISIVAQHSAKTFVDPEKSALQIVEKDSVQIRKSILPPTEKCSGQSEVLFVKSENVTLTKAAENQGKMSEDDCVFACLTNVTPSGASINCVAAEYDHSRGVCDLMTSFPATVGILPGNSVNLYEKICVSREAGEMCLGGNPKRLRQKILIGFSRDAQTTNSAAECIEMCIIAPTKMAFKCLSVMFYPNEPSSNCVLNESSAEESPSSMAIENHVRVDYFGIDQCFGITEVSKPPPPPPELLNSSDYLRLKKLKKKAMRILMIR